MRELEKEGGVAHRRDRNRASYQARETERESEREKGRAEGGRDGGEQIYIHGHALRVQLNPP